MSAVIRYSLELVEGTIDPQFEMTPDANGEWVRYTPEQAAVIAAAKRYADFYNGFLATDDVLPIHDAILDTTATLRAQEGE